MRICCLNNYPLAKTCALAQTQRLPAQHSWGVDALAQDGNEVALAPFHEPHDRSVLAALSRRLDYGLGQLDQEAYAIGRGPFDAIYSADGGSLRGIAMSKRATSRGSKIISVLHHPIGRSTFNTRVLRAHDRILCLSGRVRDEMIHEHNLSPDRVQTVAWGPDLTFPGYLSTGERDGVVAAGKTNRDMPILVRALARTGTAGLIYDLDNTVTEAPAEVRVVHSGDEGTDPAAPAQYLYAPVVDRLRDASVIAIPIRDPDRLTGLTELNDALALGKPVVMTRSPYTPIDVGSIGCGIVVEPKDDPSWTRAIATLAQDHALRRTMGQRARTFAEREWNYGRFRSALVDVIRDAVR